MQPTHIIHLYCNVLLQTTYKNKVNYCYMASKQTDSHTCNNYLLYGHIPTNRPKSKKEVLELEELIPVAYLRVFFLFRSIILAKRNLGL